MPRPWYFEEACALLTPCRLLCYQHWRQKFFDSQSHSLSLKHGSQRPGWSCTALSLQQNAKPHPQYFPADYVTTAFKACLWPKGETVVLRGHGGRAITHSKMTGILGACRSIHCPCPAQVSRHTKVAQIRTRRDMLSTCLDFSFISPMQNDSLPASHVYLHVEIHWDGPGSHQFFHEVTSPVSVLGMDSYIWAGKKSIFMTKIITAPHLSSLWQPISTKRPSSHSDSVLCFASFPPHLAEGITITEWTRPSRHSTPLI